MTKDDSSSSASYSIYSKEMKTLVK